MAFGRDLVAVHSHRGGVVGDADGQVGDRLAERIQRQHRDLTRAHGVVGLVQPVGGAQRDVGLPVQHHFGADPPDSEQHGGGLPVRGQQHRDPAAR